MADKRAEVWEKSVNLDWRRVGKGVVCVGEDVSRGWRRNEGKLK